MKIAQQQYRVLDVKVLRCTSDRGRFKWEVRESDGRLVESAPDTYATEAEALRAGNAAVEANERGRLDIGWP